jgi:arylsulfatase A-like enzyme
VRYPFSLLVATVFVSLASAAGKPNVVVFLIDDLGAVDVGCYGHPFHETPHIDKLAKDGVRFTTAYAACTVCSPTRAAILTGQYPARLHVTDWIAGHVRPFAKLRVPDWTMHLPAGTFTLANAFRNAGYATATVGKWHLGGPDYAPEKFGFEKNVAGTAMGQPPSYLSPYRIPTIADGPIGEYLTDRLTDEACRWIESKKDEPFFLYFPHYGVHTPLQAKKEVIEKYRTKASGFTKKYNPIYAAMVESVDDSVGKVRAKLAELNLADKTVIVFASDNGGLIGGARNSVTTNPPFRAGKGSAYEGGVREPFIVYWPGVSKAGLTDDRPTITMDLFPTLVAGCGLAAPADHAVDGINILPALKGEPTPPRPLYWHYPHYHPGGATPYSAVRDGNFRLVEFFEDNRVELYNLKDDVGETTDLAATMPEKAKHLRTQLAAWRKSVGAQLPTANPNYDPAKDGKK